MRKKVGGGSGGWQSNSVSDDFCSKRFPKSEFRLPNFYSIIRSFNHSKLRTRSYEKEIMDEFALGGEAMAQTLRELRFINRWLGGNAVTLQGLNLLLGGNGEPAVNGTSLEIADLGCGGGDMLVLMARWARRRRLAVRFTGVDANDYTINYARQHTASFPEIAYLYANVFSPEFQSQRYDVVTCTLFCHHFTDDELIALFRSLKQQVRVGFVINDLHRHWFAYHSIKWLTRWFSKSYLVRNDAKLSVRRSFRRADWQRILQAAGIGRYEIVWRWAFRWRIVVNSEL
jgi:2-polyprenyl-3-methyl-5-hydroxy-6-metoxy-1,4-benzoquinol methylase